MSQQDTATTSTIDKARACLKDSRTILDSALTLYFEDAAAIDSTQRDTPEAGRYLDGHAYMAAVVCAVYGRIHDALTALEGL